VNVNVDQAGRDPQALRIKDVAAQAEDEIRLAEEQRGSTR